MIERPPMVTEDVRDELVAAAASAQRANRPRYMVYIGALALVVAACFALWRLWERQQLSADLDRATALNRQIAQKVGELTAVQSIEDVLGGAKQLEADARMLGKLSQLAKDAGLTVNQEAESDDSRQTPRGISRKMYTFSLANQPAEPVLAWLRKVGTEHPGVQVRRFELRPDQGTPEGKPAWRVDVVFTRWERKS